MRRTSSSAQPWASLLLLFIFLISKAHGERWVNYTIDDQLGDEVTGRLIEYSPPGFWAQGNSCDHCAFHADNKSAFDGTWHDGSRVPEHDVEPLALQFKFNGTAFYLFNILVRLTLTDVNVTLDGKLVGGFTRFSNVSEQFLYDVPIFGQEDIPYGEHTVKMSAFGPNQTNVLFDYAIYTTNVTDDEPQPTIPGSAGGASGAAASTGSSSHNIAGPVAGGVVGGVALLLGIFLGFWWYRRRERRRNAIGVTPFRTAGGRPFEDEGATQQEKKVVDIGRGFDLAPLKVDRNIEPPTHRTSESATSPTLSSDAALRASLQVLRDQVASLRASRPLPVPSVTSTYQTTPSSPSKPELPYGSHIESEMRMLRRELEQLRTQQEARSVLSSPSSASSGSADLLQEIAGLRAEMDELRMQHDLIRGPLPSYSPPARPLPGFSTAVETQAREANEHI